MTIYSTRLATMAATAVVSFPRDIEYTGYGNTEHRGL
jgi:hypothetical protein